MIKTLLKVIGAAALGVAVCTAPVHGAQLQGGPSAPRFQNFTNALSGVGGLLSGNTLHQFTNGSTTVTSAPVALTGRGVGLGLIISPTNALLTNIVAEYRFSMDGTNWLTEPTAILQRSPGGAKTASTKYPMQTNLTEDVVSPYRFVQLWKVHITNGVDTVGSVFATNNGPTFYVTQFD